MGYVGWIRVEYKNDGFSPLPLENGYRVFRIPSEGILKTSSELEIGWAKDEYYYCDGSDCKILSDTTHGKGGKIWGGYNGKSYVPPGTEKTISGFFVGTEDQFNSYGSIRDEHGENKIGNLAPTAPK